jgi:uncharacterized cupin superfamily protein
MPAMRHFNVLTGPLVRDDDEPPGYGARYAHVARELGAERLVVKVFELQPGQSVCPYHYEYEEEWLIVLEGRPTIRRPDGEDVVDPGDAVCFASGPAGAHKVTNRSDQTVRVVMFSSGDEPAVAVYPDSNKIGVWPGNDDDRIIVRRDAAVDYWDREPER